MIFDALGYHGDSCGDSWGIMGIHGVSCGMYGVSWGMYGFGICCAHLELLISKPVPDCVACGTTLPKFQSYGSWVTTVLRCHTIPYPITSTMGTTWPIWCDGRSVFRFRWTILWLITPITPIYGYLCGMLRISTHSTRPVPNWTRGPCETAPWWLLRCGLQCRGRRTSSGRHHHGMISKYTLW